MKRFFAAAAMAPLCFAALQAQAQTTINTATTSPVATSTTGALTIDTSGSIKITDGAAVTVDTNTTVIHNGAIDITDAPTSATGILITANGGTLSSAGNINVTDTEVLKDTDTDGDLDGPFVTANTARYGVRVINPYTGNITQSSGGILMRGNNSAGIAIDNGLTGDLTVKGAIVLVGSNSYGVHVQGPMAGNIEVGGSVSVQGQNSEAVSIAGPVTGRVIIDGDISATGFRYRFRDTDANVAKLDADDLAIGGPGVRIASSVTGGVLINNAVLNTDDLDPDDDVNTPAIADPNTDEDGDGLQDDLELAATITSLGSAPALVVAGPGAITLGNVGTGKSAYGLVVKGTVQSIGLFDGVTATAIDLGGAGGSVDTTGGIRNGGVVTARATLADATALHTASGVLVPALVNEGTLSAGSSSNNSVAPTVRAVRIDAGASISTLTNNGAIAANINGSTGTAIAVVDAGGALSAVNNTGFITAGLTPNLATDIVTGRSIALDLRNNTTGVNLIQTANPISPDITPTITGDVLFGSGGANVQLLQGKMTGALAFGTGSNNLVINGTKQITDTDGVVQTVIDAAYTGALTNAGALNVSVLSGSLTATNAATINMNSLTTGHDGTLAFTADPAAGGSTKFLVAGAANLAAGTHIDLGFASKLTTATTFTLIQAGALTSGGIDASLLGDTPFFYKTSLATTATSLAVTVSRRTAAEAGLLGDRAGAFDAVFDAFDRDTGVRTAFFGKTDAATFEELYNQLLPDYSGGAFQSLANGSQAVMRVQAEEPAGMISDQPRSWLQEVGFSTRQKSTGGEISYDSAGFGVTGGIERPTQGKGTFGLSAAFISSDVDNANRRGASLLTASALLGSAYWRERVGENLILGASLTGGYTWFDSDRNVIDEDSTGARVLQRQAGAKWSGALAAARLSASYNADFGRFYLKPDAVVEYSYLYEDGYREHGAGSAVNLSVNSRTSYEAAAEAGLTMGGRFGRAFRWGPEMRIGYRQSLAEGLSTTTARFESGGAFFNLRSLSPDKGRVVVRLAVRGGSRYANIAFEATGDIGDVYQAYDGRLVVRFLF